MSLKRKSGGSFVDVSSVKRRSGGSWVNVSNVYKRVSGAWVKVWPTEPPITISGPTNYYSSGSVGGVARNKSVTTSLTVSGGNGSYSYSWAKTNESLYLATATNCSNTGILNPTFNSSIQPDGSAESDWQLTVTSGAQTATYNIHVSLNN